MGRASIKPVEGASSPLVVDWKSEERADLEEVIHDGIAIVAWDDKGLRLLKRCKLTGDYGYLPVQVKKDVVRLESADEVQASLPLGGFGIAGKIGGGFEQGKTLDIALAMVGKRRTTWNDVKRDDLTGTCDGASHYVRAILVGAFTMKTGTQGKVEAAAEIFGAGTSTSSSSSKDVGSADGKVEECDKATGDEVKPLKQCAAILRIELEPITTGSPTAQAAKTSDKQPEVKSEAIEGCPEGYVFSKGACKKAKANQPHLCATSDQADCQAQCNQGSLGSCDRLGSLLSNGRSRDPAGALAAFDKACSGGLASGCANLGINLLYGANRNPDKAIKALQVGCLTGSPRACDAAGDVWLEGLAGPKDPVKAVRYYSRGCEGGDFSSCTNAGFLFAGGGGASVERNDQKALDYGQRACFGGVPTACGNAGYKIELGQGTTPNPALALKFYDRACRLSSRECFREGFLLATGAGGVSRDDAKAKTLLDVACKSGSGLSALSCVIGAVYYRNNSGGQNKSSFEETVSKMKGQCDAKDGRACTFLGVAQYGLGQKAEAQRGLAKACSLRDALGCEFAKNLK